MDFKKIKILFLLEAVERNNQQSQRELSGHLEISLGQVNKIIQEKKTEGEIKIVDQLKGKVEYNLTPKGVAEKNKLKNQYISYSISLYSEIKRIISERLETLRKNGDDRLVFYGTGELCEIACLILCSNNCGPIKIVDDKKAGEYICGIKICQESDMSNMECDGVIIMEKDVDSSIRKRLITRGISQRKITTIFCNDRVC